MELRGSAGGIIAGATVAALIVFAGVSGVFVVSGEGMWIS